MIFTIESDVDSIPVGTFLDLGAISQGRQRILILGIRPVCNELTMVETVVHTSDCTQYLVQDTTSVVVGSIFETRTACTNLTPNHIHISSNKDAASFDPVSYIGGISHANVYIDAADNIVVIPHDPVLTYLCVDVEDDR